MSVEAPFPTNGTTGATLGASMGHARIVRATLTCGLTSLRWGYGQGGNPPAEIDGPPCGVDHR